MDIVITIWTALILLGYLAYFAGDKATVVIYELKVYHGKIFNWADVASIILGIASGHYWLALLVPLSSIIIYKRTRKKLGRPCSRRSAASPFPSITCIIRGIESVCK